MTPHVVTSWKCKSSLNLQNNKGLKVVMTHVHSHLCMVKVAHPATKYWCRLLVHEITLFNTMQSNTVLCMMLFQKRKINK